MFEKLVGPQNRNSLAADSHALKYDLDADAPEDDYSAFSGKRENVTPELANVIGRKVSRDTIIPDHATSVTHIRYLRTAYSVRKRHEGNSGVFFQGSDTPFCIEQILQFPRHENGRVLQGTWVIVRRQQQAACNYDPFIKYPHLRIKLWGPELDHTLEAMPIEHIHTHFAKCVIPWEGKKVAAIISLSRVRPPLSLSSEPLAELRWVAFGYVDSMHLALFPRV
jgi:hypothetical protein